ncbi:hypothetical protein G3P95_004744 [Escherichia coli]|nr:hypothetical protein [Escherichia coli]EFI8858217.1 hypothetical protein [Escherichia coli]EFI9169164.1 hypothetical protein [Escherichia coli]EFN0726222.1 hypothetical protein [Escherichia coli]EFV4826280.1 hypothetical protein [Escherichia coli]
MLTHDVEPVIDTLKSVRRLFSNQVTASCLRLSAGVIEELPVNDGDIIHADLQIHHCVSRL